MFFIFLNMNLLQQVEVVSFVTVSFRITFGWFVMYWHYMLAEKIRWKLLTDSGLDTPYGVLELRYHWFLCEMINTMPWADQTSKQECLKIILRSMTFWHLSFYKCINQLQNAPEITIHSKIAMIRCWAMYTSQIWYTCRYTSLEVYVHDRVKNIVFGLNVISN